MIEKRFIPDGGGQIPQTANTPGTVTNALQNANLPDDSNAPIAGFRNVERVVPGDLSYIAIRVPGEPQDYPGTTLDNITKAVLGVGSLVEHADGWQVVQP